MLNLPTLIMTVIDPFAQAFWGTSMYLLMLPHG